MSAPDARRQREAACGWLLKAEDDVATIAAVLALVPPRLGVAAYHLQQAAGKIMKGSLTAAALPFRKTHSLNELGTQVVDQWPELTVVVDPLRPCTTWSFAFRYPLDEELAEDEPTSREIEAALAHVERLGSHLDRLVSGDDPSAEGPA